MIAAGGLSLNFSTFKVAVLADDHVGDDVIKIIQFTQPDILFHQIQLTTCADIDQVAEVLDRGVRKVKTVQRRGMARVRSQLPSEAVLA